MKPDKIEIEPIGVIHTPFTSIENMPIQPKGAPDVIATVEVAPEFAAGLQDLDGFSHVYLIYYFHKSAETKLLVKPFMDDNMRGVFATRAPVRPGRIGMSVVELVKVENNVVTVKGIDVLDGTPLLDIKPYIEKFDHPENSTSGWMQADVNEITNKRSDNRFTK